MIEKSSEHKYIYKTVDPVALPASDDLQFALDKFEVKRQKTKKQAMYSFVGILSVLVLVIAIAISTQIDALKLVAVFIGASMLIVPGVLVSQYVKEFKQNLIQFLFHKRDVVISDKSQFSLRKRDLKESDLFDYFNEFEGEDWLSGSYKNVLFKAAEVEARYKVEVKENTLVNNLIFEGFYMVAELPNLDLVDITLYSKDFEFEFDKDLENYPFDSFNKRFDDHFYLIYQGYDMINNFLVPELMDKLIAFKEKYNRPFILKIKNGKVYIAINENVDLFKVSIFKKASDIKNIREDVDFVFDLIDSISSIDFSEVVI